MIRSRAARTASFAAVVSLAGLMALPSPLARADDVVLPNTKAKLAVSSGWHVATPGAAGAGTSPGSLVVAYKSDRGALLAVTRAQVPNTAAWRAKTRDAYADDIERGITDQVPGYKRVSKKIAVVHDVPTLDLEARRRDGASVVIRVLMFRTYALALAIEVPSGGDVADARSIAAGFAPPASTQP